VSVTRLCVLGWHQHCCKARKVARPVQGGMLQAISILEQYVGLFRGLSKGIMKVSEGVRKLRAGVVVSSLFWHFEDDLQPSIEDK